MNQQAQIPDPQTRARSVARWREVNQQIDFVTLQLDELIAMVETGLRSQRLARLQGNVLADNIIEVLPKISVPEL